MAKYDRVAADLRLKITAGAYPPGGRLPIESALMQQFSVSLSTVRKSLDILESEGLIERRHGIGTFVLAPRSRLHRSSARYQWEKDRVHIDADERQATGATEYDSGLSRDLLTFEAEYAETVADDDLAAAFGVAPGTPLLRRTYRTRQQGDSAPFGVATSHLVLAMISGNPDLLDQDREPWSGGTHHQLSTVGIEIDVIRDEVRARPPASHEAEVLGIRPGAALLTMRKVSIDTDGRVVEVSDNIWPSDRIELSYETKLTRWSS